MQKINIIINGVKKATKCYKNNIEVLREDAINKYRNLSEKGKLKKEILKRKFSYEY